MEPRPEAFPGKRLLTTQEMARYIGTTKATIYTMRCLQKIPPSCVVHLGRAIRFDITEVDKWLDSKRELRPTENSWTRPDGLK